MWNQFDFVIQLLVEYCRFNKSLWLTFRIYAIGTSEYRLNNRVVSFARYNAALEELNILVKARNFLVFQVFLLALLQRLKLLISIAADTALFIKYSISTFTFRLIEISNSCT
jgi:hypothetical protein